MDFSILYMTPTDLKSTPLAWKEHVVWSRNPPKSPSPWQVLHPRFNEDIGTLSDWKPIGYISKMSYYCWETHWKTISANISNLFWENPKHIYTHRNTLFNAQKQKQDWQSSGIREPTASYLAPSTEINRIYIVRVAIGASRRAWCFRTVLLLLLFQHCNRKDLQKKHEALLP